ncbi:MAG: hypothetical protein D3910_06330, partial [Candidatus Electrothrix sp. ATG2]|nr:hypothetical protein [Candidatus Electrothrix sp. ATG2]
LISWVLFGFIVKNQPWISRLQLPVFLLLPCSCILLSQLVKHTKKQLQLFRIVLSAAALFSMMFSFTALAQNKYRPLRLSNFWGDFPSREDGYYIIRNLKAEHDLIIEMAGKLQCPRVGLLSFGDTWDYPLTWRLMELGAEVQHIKSQETDEWSCIMYQAEDRQIPLKGLRWLQVKESPIWYRNLKYEFNRDQKYNKSGKGKLDLSNVIGEHKVNVFQKNNGLSLQVTGEDPYLLLPNFASTDHESAVLRLTITSMSKSSIQLFYMIDNENQYSQQHSIIKNIQPGKNELYFFLPVNRIKERLRLDFGVSGDEYTLHAAALRPVVSTQVD